MDGGKGQGLGALVIAVRPILGPIVPVVHQDQSGHEGRGGTVERRTQHAPRQNGQHGHHEDQGQDGGGIQYPDRRKEGREHEQEHDQYQYLARVPKYAIDPHAAEMGAALGALIMMMNAMSRSRATMFTTTGDMRITVVMKSSREGRIASPRPRAICGPHAGIRLNTMSMVMMKIGPRR